MRSLQRCGRHACGGEAPWRCPARSYATGLMRPRSLFTRPCGGERAMAACRASTFAVARSKAPPRSRLHSCHCKCLPPPIPRTVKKPTCVLGVESALFAVVLMWTNVVGPWLGSNHSRTGQDALARTPRVWKGRGPRRQAGRGMLASATHESSTSASVHLRVTDASSARVGPPARFNRECPRPDTRSTHALRKRRRLRTNGL